MKVIIRDETKADIDAIAEVTIAAFKTLEISDNTEQHIIVSLRAAKALAVSLVAELNSQVVGHIAFSPVSMSDGTTGWYGLGPVAILPKYHRQGIGKVLIEEGLKRLKSIKASGCCLVGHPQYYTKFGFINSPKLVFEGVPPEAFFVLPFNGDIPEGKVAFHKAFNVKGE